MGVHSISTGYERDGSSKFMWDRTNSAGHFTNWKTGEPNNGLGGPAEGCMEILRQSGENGTWNDVQCSSKYPFVCKTG